MQKEKRKAKRYKVHLVAERISGNQRYGVFIENISEYGIQIITTSTKAHEKYSPGTDIDLKFHLTSGDVIDLKCKVKWVHLKIPTNGFVDCIGLEILNPPSKYIKFVRGLT